MGGESIVLFGGQGRVGLAGQGLGGGGARASVWHGRQGRMAFLKDAL